MSLVLLPISSCCCQVQTAFLVPKYDFWCSFRASGLSTRCTSGSHFGRFKWDCSSVLSFEVVRRLRMLDARPVRIGVWARCSVLVSSMASSIVSLGLPTSSLASFEAAVSGSNEAFSPCLQFWLAIWLKSKSSRMSWPSFWDWRALKPGFDAVTGTGLVNYKN